MRSAADVPLYVSMAFRSGGAAAASLVQALSYLLLARALGLGDFGLFGALFAAGSFGYVISGVGAAPRMLRLQAESNADLVRSALFVLRGGALAIILTLMAIAGGVLGLPPESVVMATSFVAVDAITDVGQPALSGMGRLRAATGLLVAQRCAMAAAVALFALVPGGAVPGLIAIPLVATATAAVYPILVVRRRVDPAGLWAVVRGNGGYWMTNLAASLGQLEVPLVAVLGAPALAGIYAAAARLISVVTIFSQAVGYVLTPRLASVSSNDARAEIFARGRRATWMLQLGTVGLAVPIGLAAAALLGSDYSAGWYVFSGFVVGGGLMSVNQGSQALLLAEGRAADAARCVAVGALCGIVLAAAGAESGLLWVLAMAPASAQGVMMLLFRRTLRARRGAGSPRGMMDR